MSPNSISPVSRIPLEKPASIRRQFPLLDEQGWMISDFFFGNENRGLSHLFDEASLQQLHSLSPVVLYGEKGSGKTALAITLAVCWARLTRLRPLCFTSGKSFAEEYAAAVEIDDIDSFRKRYRQCRLLVIDDLEPTTRKSAAQQELVVTLDHLASVEAPVVVTCGKIPAALEGILPALASRLSAGYSTCLVGPGPEAVASIVEALVCEIDRNLSATELSDFCSRLSKPLKAPDLKTIVMIAHQNPSPSGGINFDVLSQLVTQFFDGTSLSVADIAKTVARKMGIKLSDLRGSTRLANVVRARGLAILLSRRLTPSSLQQIGQFFGGRDHSTVLHACRKTSSLIASDAELAKTLADVQADLLA